MKSSSRKSSKDSKSNQGSNQDSVILNQNPEPEALPPQAQHKRTESCPGIGETILQKDFEIKSHIAELRQIEKAKQLKELREVPKINSKSKKHMKTRSQEDMIAFIESMPKSSRKGKKQKKPKKIDTRRPQDYIPAPDVSGLKEVLNRLPEKITVEKINLEKMTLVEKTEYFNKKKNEKLKEAEKKKLVSEKKICTFKPDLEKRTLLKAKNAKTETSEKISPKNSRPKLLDKGSKVEQVEEQIRIPPPNKHHKTNSVAQAEANVLLSSHYSQFSPIVKNYSFKEGANIKELRNRSQKMLTYNAYTNRK